MASTFRVYGPEVGMSTAVVDADVVGVTDDFNIELSPKNGDNGSFSISITRLSELMSENLAFQISNVDENAEIWKAIEDVEVRYENAENDEDVFIDAAKVLFRGSS